MTMIDKDSTHLLEPLYMCINLRSTETN